jgi:hypothetical protein
MGKAAKMGKGKRFGLAAACALAALAPQARAANTAYMDFSWAESGHAFTLGLSGQMDNVCAPMFSHADAKLTGGKLVLSVLAQSNPAALCAAGAKSDYRTEFDLPALKAGTYPVQVLWTMACQYSPSPCPVAYDPQDVGTLKVTDSADLEYRFHPRAVAAGKRAELRLNGDFNCGDAISGVSADTSGRAVYLSFTVDPHPEIMCISPFPGIDFTLPEMRAGAYQVMAARSPYCAPGKICLRLKIAPQLAGALDVLAATSLAPGMPRERIGRKGAARSMSPAGFRVEGNGMIRDAAGRKSPARAPKPPHF